MEREIQREAYPFLGRRSKPRKFCEAAQYMRDFRQPMESVGGWRLIEWGTFIQNEYPSANLVLLPGYSPRSGPIASDGELVSSRTAPAMA